jgi:WD40 repeat protein
VGWNEPRAQLWRTPASNRIAQLPSRGSALAGDQLVTQSDGKLMIRDVVTGAVRAEWVSQPDVDINDHAWLTSDGRRAVVARDSTTSLVDLTSRPDKLDEVALPARTSLTTILSPDGRRVLDGSDRGVRVLDAATGRVIRALAVTGSGSGAFSPDGERLVLTFGDQPSRMWRISTGEELALHAAGRATGARFDRAGRRLVLYGGDLAVMVDPATGAPLATFGVAGGSRIDAVEFDDASRRLVTHGTDRAAKLWDLDSRALLLSVEASLAASISHDGRRLVTSHHDGTLQIWDVASGRVIGVIHDQQNDFELMWSPDDSRLVTTSYLDHMAAIWDVHLADPAQVAAHAEQASRWQLVDGQLVPRSAGSAP